MTRLFCTRYQTLANTDRLPMGTGPVVLFGVACNLARPKRFELLPSLVVWARPLKSLRSVTVRRPLLVEIDAYRQLLNAFRYRIFRSESCFADENHAG